MAEDTDIPGVLGPDDDGQQEEAPERNMKPHAGNDVQQHENDGFVGPSDVNTLPENVDHW